MKARTGRTALVAAAAALVTSTAGAAAVHRTIASPPYASDDLLVVLAIGSDEGPPHRPADPLRARADAIHVIAVDTRTAAATILDIPRDAWIGGVKVNAHLTRGGPERLEGAVEQFVGVPVDFWVLATFKSVEEVVEGLGGVEVVVDRPMHDRFSGTDLEPGTHRLGGPQALAFTRDRMSLPDGDIGRSHNQGRFLRAAHAQLRHEASDLPGILDAIELLSRNTVSNIPPAELVPMALLALRVDPAAVEQVTLTGPLGFVGAESVLRPAHHPVLDELRAGQAGP